MDGNGNKVVIEQSVPDLLFKTFKRATRIHEEVKGTDVFAAFGAWMRSEILHVLCEVKETVDMGMDRCTSAFDPLDASCEELVHLIRYYSL